MGVYRFGVGISGCSAKQLIYPLRLVSTAGQLSDGSNDGDIPMSRIEVECSLESQLQYSGVTARMEGQ